MKSFRFKNLKPDYFRNLIFGAEDSLVSTVGVVFGIASASYDKTMILMTGLIVIVVEALSMGAGSYLSEESTNEMEQSERSENPIVSGVIMFFSYFFAGFIPLSPYVLFSVNTAKYVSVVVTLIALFLLGYIPQKNLKGGVRMTVIAGTAVILGYIIASLFNTTAPLHN